MDIHISHTIFIFTLIYNKSHTCTHNTNISCTHTYHTYVHMYPHIHAHNTTNNTLSQSPVDTHNTQTLQIKWTYYKTRLEHSSHANTQHTTHATAIQAHTTHMQLCKYQIYTCTQPHSYIPQVIHTHTPPHIWREINACIHTSTSTHYKQFTGHIHAQPNTKCT